MGKQLAMCPQYNSVFGKLTVDESLNFIASIKGMNE
jgi:ABC-type multidrug transport system ATPase subunit